MLSITPRRPRHTARSRAGPPRCRSWPHPRSSSCTPETCTRYGNPEMHFLAREMLHYAPDLPFEDCQLQTETDATECRSEDISSVDHIMNRWSSVHLSQTTDFNHFWPCGILIIPVLAGRGINEVRLINVG